MATMAVILVLVLKFLVIHILYSSVIVIYFSRTHLTEWKSSTMGNLLEIILPSIHITFFSVRQYTQILTWTICGDWLFR